MTRGAHCTPEGREKKYRVDDTRLAVAVAQLESVGSAWDARLQRIKRIAERMEADQVEADQVERAENEEQDRD